MTLKLTNIGQLVTFDSRTNRVEKVSSVEVIIEQGLVTEIGERLPAADKQIDVQGCLVTPGFVDPHTHPIFAETRENEFAMRVAGKSYEHIAASGGGIKSSVRALRRMDEETLAKRVESRMKKFLRLGTTTVEAKSGYGLSTESELKSLKILRTVEGKVPIEIVPTFLGAHDFPEEFNNNRAAYVDLVCDEMIPAVAEQGVAEFCDVFCERGWFDVGSSRRILTGARDAGMKLRLHADEFEDSGGASLAAEMNAFSADHLMQVCDDGVREMAEKGVKAILLPGTTFFLGKRSYAPARRLMDAGVEVALASDFNPGSSMIQSMSFIMSLACLYLGMTIEEAFIGATFMAAKTVDREKVVGSIEVGKQADLILWGLKNLAEIPYRVNGGHIRNVIKNGKPLFASEEEV